MQALASATVSPCILRTSQLAATPLEYGAETRGGQRLIFEAPLAWTRGFAAQAQVRWRCHGCITPIQDNRNWVLRKFVVYKRLFSEQYVGLSVPRFQWPLSGSGGEKHQ